MISSVFGKTKPVNYIILLAFLFLLYWYVHLILFHLEYDTSSLINQVLISSLVLFTVFLVDFIVHRNQINETNSYAILFYVLLFVVFPEVVTDNQAILCSFFVLLAARRLISMRTLKNIQQKVFDASLWIMISSFFYDWAIIFMILVFMSIYFYDPKNFKNWLIPLVAFITIGLIASSWLVFTNRVDFFQEHFIFSISSEINLSSYWLSQLRLNLFLALVILAILLAFVNLNRFGQGRIISIRLIATLLVISIFITLIKTSEGLYPVVLTFFPTAVILARYIEVFKRKKLKEILLIVIVIVPFIVFASEWILK
ncbi:MAG: hypothetical protein HKN52_11385 [Eudoraea sp.]|nr:hypothetical protein [Eudoraea sp.]